jgi:hypothetical protein
LHRVQNQHSRRQDRVAIRTEQERKRTTRTGSIIDCLFPLCHHQR